ncbi:hypothetical protein Taro_000852, partial [Colocasia esculenta]|nr:hypothetical protein [Colocasia esculenta]
NRIRIWRPASKFAGPPISPAYKFEFPPPSFAWLFVLPTDGQSRPHGHGFRPLSPEKGTGEAKPSATTAMKASAAVLLAPPCFDCSTEAAGSGVYCSSSSSSKAICPICYEDLKPIVEDLQSVSLCGHVFHELCLQQWLEYCPAGKGCTCPVCKQSCTRGGVMRLYFQSTGCADLSQQPAAQKTLSEAEAEALCGEISKLQGKLSAVGYALDAQKQHVEELNSEVSRAGTAWWGEGNPTSIGSILVWKERAKKEEEMKNEHRKEKELARRLLQIKEADLAKTSEECAKHQERSLSLAKELAALKLAMDVNLGEEEIAKLASLGHGNRHADAIDVLQKSLFLRNKSYKELMAQCNLLGRAETRSLQKLEKAEEKIKKLKKRLQELDKALEKKDSEILRGVKVTKGKRERRADVDCFKQNADSRLASFIFWSCPSKFSPDLDRRSYSKDPCVWCRGFLLISTARDIPPK